MASRVIPVDPFDLVIVGATGDLARRKILPGLFRRYLAGQMPAQARIIGAARSDLDDDGFREMVRAAIAEFGGAERDDPALPEFLAHLHYVPVDARGPDGWAQLRDLLRDDVIRAFYFSVGPSLFGDLAERLEEFEISTPQTRVVVEKPFGRDLQSARALNATLAAHFDESQIYRIDHYLGKETVQNILTFRFGNSIFEPLFDRRYVDSVQITVAEPLGMEGKRGHYYDKAGAMRDMVQNHMMQLLCLTAMEPPSGLEANAIRDEKVKVLRSLMPMTPEEVAAHTVRGQYVAGVHEGDAVKGYLEEEGVGADSLTETYVAMRFEIDNWRWAGVPFLMRTGKRLRKKTTEVAIFFKQPPLQFFRRESSPNLCLLSDRPKANQLVFRIQPEEGISLTFASKRPGMQIELEEVNMDFFYREAFDERSPEAYERLLLDAWRGDPSLFTRSDEVEYAWRFISSIHEGWASRPDIEMAKYRPYTDGPDEAQRLVRGCTKWRQISKM